MTTIYKYPLRFVDLIHVEMPRDAKILHAGFDPNGQLCLWAVVDTDKPKHTCAIKIVGTGNQFESPHLWTFVSTVIDATFVWHIFAFNYEATER